MRTVLVLAASFAGTAYAGDFRQLDFGSSCADVRSQDLTLGSETDSTFASDQGILHFRGVAFEKKVSYTYLCPQGYLAGGSYLLPSEPLELAKESYKAIFEKISHEYGVPFIDNSPWSHRVHPGMVRPEDVRYMSSWRTPRVVVTISLGQLDGEPKDGWRVFVSYSPSITREGSNTSLERTRER
jgi:hypothetical protein